LSVEETYFYASWCSYHHPFIVHQSVGTDWDLPVIAGPIYAVRPSGGASTRSCSRYRPTGRVARVIRLSHDRSFAPPSFSIKTNGQRMTCRRRGRLDRMGNDRVVMGGFSDSLMTDLRYGRTNPCTDGHPSDPRRSAHLDAAISLRPAPRSDCSCRLESFRCLASS